MGLPPTISEGDRAKALVGLPVQSDPFLGGLIRNRELREHSENIADRIEVCGIESRTNHVCGSIVRIVTPSYIKLPNFRDTNLLFRFHSRIPMATHQRWASKKENAADITGGARIDMVCGDSPMTNPTSNIQLIYVYNKMMCFDVSPTVWIFPKSKYPVLRRALYSFRLKHFGVPRMRFRAPLAMILAKRKTVPGRMALTPQ
jgi:hypothetical protein